MPILTYINFGIFPGGVSFSNGFDAKRLLKLYKRDWKQAFKQEYKFFEDSNYAYAKVWLGSMVYYFIYTKNKFTYTDYEYCKLAHEVLHICQVYLVDILDRNTEREAEAYLHTHIMTKCLEAIRQQ